MCVLLHSDGNILLITLRHCVVSTFCEVLVVCSDRFMFRFFFCVSKFSMIFKNLDIYLARIEFRKPVLVQD